MLSLQALQQRTKDLLGRMGTGRVSIAAYDTAFLGRLPQRDDPSRPAFPRTLDWLRQHQHPDGSWGAQHEYYHDRIISTLAAVLTLGAWNQSPRDKARCQRGLQYIWDHIHLLAHDPYETVGFELVVPTLTKEAMDLGMRLPAKRFAQYQTYRQRKLGRIPERLLYAPQNPALYSLEFMGSHLDTALAKGAQEPNGSIGNSPSATAFFLRHAPDDDAAWRYVHSVMALNRDGAVFSFPLDVFERTWVLYNLEMAGLMQDRQLCQPHVEHIRQAWHPQRGVSFSQFYSACDLDDTALAYKVLHRAGQSWQCPAYQVSASVFETYAETDHYRTFAFETDPSLSANIHLLDALSVCPERSVRQRGLEVLLPFMRRTRSLDAFWFDKWHASPYYVTTHAILALLAYDHKLIENAVYWLLHSQNPDGSWGHYDSPTIEESAYCLQALAACRAAGLPIPRDNLDRAAHFVAKGVDDCDYPPLWIAKTLFCPQYIVESSILGALAMYQQVI